MSISSAHGGSNSICDYFKGSRIHLHVSLIAHKVTQRERLFGVVACGWSDYFHCNRRCVPSHQVCDGVSHCPNGEDERNCCMYKYYTYAVA